jgi:hypothetical protein
MRLASGAAVLWHGLQAVGGVADAMIEAACLP